MYEAFLRGDRKASGEIYFRTLPLVHFCSELSLAASKEVLAIRGVIATSRMKTASRELREPKKKELLEILKWVEASVLEKTGIEPFGPAST